MSKSELDTDTSNISENQENFLYSQKFYGSKFE